MIKNSSINLSVTNNSDGFTLSGQSNYSGRAFSITSGDITIEGGATILDGQLLIGNSSTNSFDQGNLYAGNGIVINSGAGVLQVSMGLSGVAPSTNTLTMPVSIPTYGSTGKIMGTPIGWIDILVSGISRKLPFY